MRFLDPMDSIYEGTVYRPPSEATSLILQATIGCSHNKCTFCVSFLDKEFRIKSLKEIEMDVKKVLPYYRNEKRIFLADGDALKIPTPDLVGVLEMLHANFPKLERVTIYGSPGNIKHKTVEELRSLKKAGLDMIYIGLETGSDVILKAVKKGANSKSMIEASKKIKESGLKLSVIFILGIGGKERSEEHARETARVLNAMDPEYAGALTLMVVEPAPICKDVEEGRLTILSPKEILSELRKLVEGLGLTKCMFRVNHASNYAPIGGTLPEDKDDILHQIDEALERTSYKPEWMRAL